MHSSGLRCSHNSDLDTKIPRPKLPKRALPDCLRKQLKGVVVDGSFSDDNDVYKAGAGVLAPVGSAPDGKFLKRGSGIPMSVRASALAQRRGDAVNARAVIHRPQLVNGEVPQYETKDSIRFANRKESSTSSKQKNKYQYSKTSNFTALPPINQKNRNNNVAASKHALSKTQSRADVNKSPTKNTAVPSRVVPKKPPHISLSTQMQVFLQNGNTPRMCSESEERLLSKKLSKPKYQVKFDLVQEALTIMNKVNETYGKKLGTEDNVLYGPGDLKFHEEFYGPSISQRAACAWLDTYLTDNDVVGKVSISWTNEGDGLDRDVGSKYDENEDKVNIVVHENFPGIRRAFGVQMFAHQEVCTKALRCLNDVHQPWNNDRRNHGISSQGSREAGATEEGFAVIHSTLGCNDPSHRYLWNIAVHYYACAMGHSMTFGELFDHLSTWVSDKTKRFNICIRVKKGACGNNPSVGSSGQYQCYFEGAHAILTRVVSDPLVDLRELYLGRICLKDMDQAVSIADKHYLLLPSFMGGIETSDETYNAYVEQLKEVAILNGICSKV